MALPYINEAKREMAAKVARFVAHKLVLWTLLSAGTEYDGAERQGGGGGCIVCRTIAHWNYYDRVKYESWDNAQHVCFSPGRVTPLASIIYRSSPPHGASHSGLRDFTPSEGLCGPYDSSHRARHTVRAFGGERVPETRLGGFVWGTSTTSKRWRGKPSSPERTDVQKALFREAQVLAELTTLNYQSTLNIM